MCGRYRQTRAHKRLEEHFSAEGEVEVSPRYNIAPSQPVVAIRQGTREPVRKLSNLRWGLIPSWAKDISIGYKTINARAETVANTPSFRDAFKSQRCLVPADGFYEWQRIGKTKQPYCFEMNGGDLFAFAGLWDRWTSPQGQVIESCTILTTTPNSLLTDIHDRMPVILNADDYDLWLDPAFRDAGSLSEMLKPFDAALMNRYPVSNRVNQVRTDDADCARPVDLVPQPAQSMLF